MEKKFSYLMKKKGVMAIIFHEVALFKQQASWISCSNYKPTKISISRLLNLLFKSINKTIGTRIANKIGNPLMVDAPKSGLVWGPFLRIKDDIDITKPLMKGKMVHIANVEEGWFSNMRN